MEQENGSDWRSIYTRVLGNALNKYVGQGVLLMGEVTNVDHTGTSMQLRTTDKVDITVQLPQDTMDMPQGLVELRGTVINGNSLNCDDLIKFETDPQDFDSETYSEAVRLMLAGGNAWAKN